MKNPITISKEDYLKAVLEAESEGQEVIPATLAHWLSVSPPAVTMALKRLRRDGYLEVKPDGIVRLLPKGKETAYRTALRHHLIERMLAEMFGMEWYEVHDEAERLEHAVSPAFEAKLLEKLGAKGTCPHGNSVLPENPEQRIKRGMVLLSEAREDSGYTVVSMYERDPKLLLFLPPGRPGAQRPGKCSQEELRPHHLDRNDRWPFHFGASCGGEGLGQTAFPTGKP